MTVSPSRFIPSLKKGDTIERRDLETAILASSFYFHFVNEIYYYYYYYYRCNPPSIERAKSLSGRLIVPGKRKREKRKKEIGRNIVGQRGDIFVAPSFIERSNEQVTEGTVVHVSLLLLYRSLHACIYPTRPIDING